MGLLAIYLITGVAMANSPPPIVITPPLVSAPEIRVMSGRELPYLARIHSAREAVMAAADQPGGYLGRVAFSVRAIGWDGGRLFLNSEEDYRDPRNLSVVVGPQVAHEALELLGGEAGALQRKLVVATGQFKRVRVEFLDAKERPTGKYYYQTHLAIGSLNQLRVVPLN